MVSLQDISEYRKNKICVSKLKYISTENMLQNFAGIIPYTSEEDISGVEFCVGDTLLANIRPYLRKAWLATHDGACSTDVLALCPSDITPAFLNNIIEQDRFIDYVMSGVKGSKMPRGDKAHILAYETAIPSLLEQEKINSFMQLLHQRIAKIQMEIELLKKYKRGLNKLVFEKITSGAKQQIPLSELCESISSGRTTSSNADGIFPLFGSTGVVGKTNIIEFDGDIVLIARVGANAGKVNYFSGQCAVTDNTLVIRVKENLVQAKFLAFFLEYYNLHRLIFGSGQPLVTGGQLKKIKMPLVSLTTQVSLTQRLEALDSIIEAHEKYAQSLTLLKSGLMQQLFI